MPNLLDIFRICLLFDPFYRFRIVLRLDRTSIIEGPGNCFHIELVKNAYFEPEKDLNLRQGYVKEQIIEADRKPKFFTGKNYSHLSPEKIQKKMNQVKK